MLNKILSKEECANCRICCCFDSSDIWEAPVITRSKADEILEKYNSDQKFHNKDDNYYILDMKKRKMRICITALCWTKTKAALCRMKNHLTVESGRFA